MKPKNKRRITKLESTNQRRLHLSRDTVRALGVDELSRVAGGSGCDTTSWSTEQTKTTINI